MKDYIIDMKFYNSVPEDEIGIQMPMDIVVNGKVRPGIYPIVINTTERLLDELMEKIHPDIKILGVHSITL
jgi:hypothetical protein